MTSRKTHDRLPLRIALGTRNLGKVKNKTTTWGELRQKLSEPTRTKEPFKRYLALPKEEQDRLKNIDGYWIGAHCADGRRASNAITERDIVCFDIDDAPADLVDRLKIGLTGISGYEFAVHSTRKHHPDKPRLRIAFPLAHAVSAEKFTPFIRILASKLDPTMDAVDDVSFRLAQMMFQPSCSADSEFIFIHNPGALVDPDAILTEFGDWQDYTKLPFSERQGQKRPSAKKAENPLSKKGLVGAFCRAYDVEAAIAEFLPDVYTPGDQHSGKPRYSYLGGSTSNGVAVEDGGLFIYSHHTTDPCSDRLCNAFDMVRLHKFGSEDSGKDEEGSPTKQPSYKAMVEFLKDDQRTIRELAAERYDLEAMFDDSDLEGVGNTDAATAEPEFDEDIEALLGRGPTIGTAAENEPETDWISQLDLNEDGGIRATLTNNALILQNDRRMRGVVAHNEFTEQIVCRRDLVSKMPVVPVIRVADKVGGDIWSDRHDHALRAIIEAPNGRGKAGYGLKVSDRDLKGAVNLAAQTNTFHPVREYLRSLRWDGVKRIATFWKKYLGSPDDEYHRQVALIMLVAAVARVHEPGHKFDTAIIIEGIQGTRKSSFIKVLSRGWFGELHGDMGDRKKMVELMMARWITELPELSTLTRSDVNDVKALLSAAADIVRLAWDRRAFEFKRQCIFIGSTNDRKYLKDETGNRRFLPVTLDTQALGRENIDTDALEREIDQIWAEAVVEYDRWRERHPKCRGDLPLTLTGEAALAAALQLQESRKIESAEEGLAGQIGEWLDRRVPVSALDGSDDISFDAPDEPMAIRTRTCLTELWVECLGRDIGAYGPQQAQLLGRAVGQLRGWVGGKRDRIPKYGQQRTVVRDDASPDEVKRGYRLVEHDDEEVAALI
jgi:putative DNA primase/helicase